MLASCGATHCCEWVVGIHSLLHSLDLRVWDFWKGPQGRAHCSLCAQASGDIRGLAHTLFPRVPCHVKVLPGTPLLSAFLLHICESCVRFLQWSSSTWPQSPSRPRTGPCSSRCCGCSRSRTAGCHCKCAASRPCKPGKSYELVCLSNVFYGFSGCTCLAARVLRPRPHPLTFFHCLLRV
jgi:hypothetical protein